MLLSAGSPATAVTHHSCSSVISNVVVCAGLLLLAVLCAGVLVDAGAGSVAGSLLKVMSRFFRNRFMPVSKLCSSRHPIDRDTGQHEQPCKLLTSSRTDEWY